MKENSTVSLMFHNCYCSASLSMNGCYSRSSGDPITPLETIQTLTFSPVSTLQLAMERLNTQLNSQSSPESLSGIIRFEVPIEQEIEAIGWLSAQDEIQRCYFSGRNHRDPIPILDGANGDAWKTPVSVAGLGAAVFFQQTTSSFSVEDWRCIKRFLSEDSPLIRAYGAIRFDAGTSISSEWEGFGSFYFTIPQVECVELKGSSMLAMTIAWDNKLLWTWRKAVETLQATLCKISSATVQFRKEAPSTFILGVNHAPNKTSWDIAVNKALRMITRNNSELVKVVLARSSRIITATDLDPIEWLACLQGEGQNAYQFCIQPPGSPAFIGNTPEQLFHRKHLSVSSEALAGTRARGKTRALDIEIENDLLSSPKDHLEFTIVRESIRNKLEDICDLVLVEPKKVIRKLPRVQHLYAQLLGRLRSEDDEFEILSSLHPSPAVCGFPTEGARQFIVETEMFDRGMYAGPVGWFGGRETEFAVGIRSALVEKDVGALIYAGAGIVQGTRSSLEWEELELKTSQFTKLIKHDKSLSVAYDGLQMTIG
ncbi:isochorismate synthase [Ranunculus cassubicifolius]